MDVVTWAFWALSSALGLLWTLVWFLIGGWVSTLLQLLVVIGGIFVFKYGWQRAPQELFSRARVLLRYGLNWIGKREPQSADGEAARERVRIKVVRRKEPGDVNLSTAMSLLMLSGLLLVAVT